MNAFAKPNLAIDQIPSASAADKDKVLTIDANGVPVWAENQGGGSGGGATIVHASMDTTASVLDMTAGVIFEAAQAGPVILVQTVDGEVIAVSPVQVGVGKAGYYVIGVDTPKYISATADGYPTATDE